MRYPVSKIHKSLIGINLICVGSFFGIAFVVIRQPQLIWAIVISALLAIIGIVNLTFVWREDQEYVLVENESIHFQIQRFNHVFPLDEIESIREVPKRSKYTYSDSILDELTIILKDGRKVDIPPRFALKKLIHRSMQYENQRKIGRGYSGEASDATR